MTTTSLFQRNILFISRESDRCDKQTGKIFMTHFGRLVVNLNFNVPYEQFKNELQKIKNKTERLNFKASKVQTTV